MSDLLAALRRELHELECQAERGWSDEEAMAHLRARIATLENADGNALGTPTIGAVA